MLDGRDIRYMRFVYGGSWGSGEEKANVAAGYYVTVYLFVPSKY